MKKEVVFFLMMLWSVIIAAQPFGHPARGYRIIKMDYDNASGELGTSWFRYDNKGILYRAFWALENGKRSSENFFESDADGKVISTYRKFSDSISSQELFEYDTLGNKITEHFFRTDGVEGFASYIYQEGKLVKADFYKYKGWFTGVARYHYNPAGILISAEVEDNGKQECIIKYSYDSEGNLIEEYWDFSGKWYQQFKYYYEKIEIPFFYYTNPCLCIFSNKQIKKEEYSFNNKSGGPSKYLYNKEGLLELKIFNRSDGFQTVTRYSYDTANRLDMSYRKVKNGKDMTFRYYYNAINKLILRQYIQADTMTGFESYQYNQWGELERAFFKNMDGWLTGSITFMNDGLGLPVTGYFKGENMPDAILRIIYNKEKQVTSIRWDFTNGTFQLYEYDY